MDSISEEYAVAQAVIGSAQPGPVISVRGLVKCYGSHEAVAGIDLEVRRGEIFAFLGPNGAGQTATVEILEGFQRRTEGQVCVLGYDPAAAGGAWRDRVGVVLQEAEPEPSLSVRECLAMYAGFYRAPRDIDQTIALVGLTGQVGALGTRLSGGPPPGAARSSAQNAERPPRQTEPGHSGVPSREVMQMAAEPGPAIQCGENAVDMVTPAAARAEFDAEVTYLDTATMGLPPWRSWLALQEALVGWRAGTADAVGYDRRWPRPGVPTHDWWACPPSRWPSEARCRRSPG